MATTCFGIIWHADKNTICSGVFVVAHSGGGEHMGCSASIYDGIVGKQVGRGKW